MTTAWGATEHWAAPAIALGLARDTAAGRGPAAVKEISPQARAGVIIALAAQVRMFAADAARHGVTSLPDPQAWQRDVPCTEVRDLAAGAMAGDELRIPARPCAACCAAMLERLARELLAAMTAAGAPPGELCALLDWLAARAR